MFFRTPAMLGILFVVLALASHVAAVPVPLQMQTKLRKGEKPTHQGQRNYLILENDLDEVNRHIHNALFALAPGQVESYQAKILIESAFGPQAYTTDTVAVILRNFKKMRDAVVVTSPEFSSRPQELGTTWRDPGGIGELVEYGIEHYQKEPRARVATMIHEASHFACGTVDGGRMCSNGRHNCGKGYTSHSLIPDTVDMLRQDEKYQHFLRHVQDTYNNAESYAVFAILCGNLANLPPAKCALPPPEHRGRVRRALVTGNVAHLDLIRREPATSCMMPERKGAKKSKAPVSTPPGAKGATNMKKPASGGKPQTVVQAKKK